MKTIVSAILLIMVITIVQAQDSAATPDKRMEDLGKHYEALSEQSNLVLEKIQHESRILLFRSNAAFSAQRSEAVEKLLKERRMMDVIQEETEQYFFPQQVKPVDCSIG